MWTDVDGFKTDFIERESGDGDSGAEYKDPSALSPLMPRRSPGQDYKEVKDALGNITREVQGAEKPKDVKKSRIPVRTNNYKPGSEEELNYGINNKSEMSEKDSRVGWKVSEEMWYEAQDWEEETKELIHQNDDKSQDFYLLSDVLTDYRDIYEDLSKEPEINDQTSDETSLSPRAPIAEEELIIEAPEQFREDITNTNIDSLSQCETTELSNAYNNKHISSRPDVRCGFTETEHERDNKRGKEIDAIDKSRNGANQDIITTIQSGGIDNYYTCGPTTVVNGVSEKEGDCQPLALSILRVRAAMKTISQATHLKIVENLEHLTKYCENKVLDCENTTLCDNSENKIIETSDECQLKEIIYDNDIKITENLERIANLRDKSDQNYNNSKNKGDLNLRGEKQLNFDDSSSALLKFYSKSKLIAPCNINNEYIEENSDFNCTKQHSILEDVNKQLFNKYGTAQNLNNADDFHIKTNNKGEFSDSLKNSCEEINNDYFHDFKEINSQMSEKVDESNKNSIDGSLETSSSVEVTRKLEKVCETPLKIVENLKHLKINDESTINKHENIETIKIYTNSCDFNSQLSLVNKADVTTYEQKCFKDESFKYLLNTNQHESETHLQLYTNEIDYIDDLDDVKDRSLQTISDIAVMKEISVPKLSPIKVTDKNLKLSEGNRIVEKKLEVMDDLPCLLKPMAPLKMLSEGKDVVDFSKTLLFSSEEKQKEVLSVNEVFAKYKKEKEDILKGSKKVLFADSDIFSKHSKTIETENSSETKLVDSKSVNDSACETDLETTLNVSKDTNDKTDINSSAKNIPDREAACERSAVAAAAAVVVASIQSADAQATRRSRVSTAKVRATHSNINDKIDTTGDTFNENDAKDKNLLNDNENLVIKNYDVIDECETSVCDLNSDGKPTLFDAIVKCSEKIESEINEDILRSRDINKKSEGNSRLKLLEEKLKEAAGLTDKKQKVPEKPVILDKNDNECKQIIVEQNTIEELDEEFYPDVEITELGSPADLDAFLDDRFGGRCEFDVRRIGTFTGYGGNEFFVVYDELEEDSEDEECRIKIEQPKMRGEGNQDAPKRHNPDHDNLKSLLKKPGRKETKKNRVSFNETKNEFFDADYIILIREDCDYDEDDDDGVCTCNQHEMVRLTCCEPDCNCNAYEDQTPQSPKFAPPLEFVDSVTLSPPEGYKDMDQQLLALQQMARQRGAVCRECSGHHDSGKFLMSLLKAM